MGCSDGTAASTTEAAGPIPVVIGNALGWYGPGTTGRGVLLCGTYGFEQMCAYRSWRALERVLAAAGCKTLRLDYPGHGDSGEPDPQYGSDVAASLAMIRRGITFLREEAGAEEIVLVGLRLGASLAALAAAEEGVDRLVLLAPFASGQAYIREMTMQARILDVLPDRSPLPQPAGSLMVGSFHLGAETLAALPRIDLLREERLPAPRILLLGANTGRLAEHYRKLGGAVETGAFPELTQLVSDPIFARTPEATFGLVRNFVASGMAAWPAEASPPAVSGTPCRITGEGWTEETARFGPGLVGILCRPPQTSPGSATVILVNSGRNVRSGQGRQTAAMARRLAGIGIASFRFDPRGIGDSADRPDGGLPVYAADAVPEVRAALDHLCTLNNDRHFVILGSCSGAFLAYKSLCEDERLRAALLVNPYLFDVKAGTDIEGLIRDSFRNGLSYSARARQGRFWRRLLTGEIRLRAVVRAVWRDGMEQARRWTARIPWFTRGETVGRQVSRLRRRGARLRMVYSSGDQGIPVLHAHFGTSSKRMTCQFGYPVTILEGVDHSLSMPADQDRLFLALAEVVNDVRRQTLRPGCEGGRSAARHSAECGAARGLSFQSS